jgi:uncharacterized phage protein (TIGR02220 family)
MSGRDGFIKSWRQELKSNIWEMPPLYHRVWHFLLQSVSWEKNVFPTGKMYGIHLNHGQQLFSIQGIVDGVSWKERNVTKKPNKKTILHILKWLEFQGMIARESNGNGTFISICNWCKYQSSNVLKVTQGTPQSIPQGTPQSIHTKEVKEVKEEVKDIDETPPRQQQNIPFKEIISFLNEKTGKGFKHTTKATQGHIRARWTEGFRVDDFNTVITNKTDEWINDNKMNQYLRPETLFGTKFESYLVAASQKISEWE